MKMNEELEKDIVEKERVINPMKKELRKATDRVQVFEDEFEIEFDETIKIRDRAELYKSETAHYKKELLEPKHLIVKFEQKQDVTNSLLTLIWKIR